MDARNELAVTLSLLLGCAACAPPPQPKQMPPQAVTQQTPDPPPPSDPPPAAEPKSGTVVVDPGGNDADKAPTLAEAARAEKERRGAMAKPAVVINDKNLQQYASKGQITTAQPAPREAKKPATADARGEDYWRSRGREIRQRWHDAADQAKAGQLEVEKLRTAFYAEDDPYVRDGRIKPEWDHALQKLDESRRAIETAKKDLDTFMEEGQRAGAYQAWLEDGVDLEPPPTPAAPKKSAEPGEPKVINDVPQPPPGR